MKKILLFLCSLAMGAVLWAQAPQSFSYQAVVRDANGQVAAQQKVGVRLSLLQGADMVELYAEEHHATTNAAGLITIAVGEGQPLSDCTMECVDWGNGPVFLRTEVDPAGGDDYQLTTTQQLLSVPYALWAANGLRPEDMELIDGLVVNLGEMYGSLVAEIDGKASIVDLTALAAVADSLAGVASKHEETLAQLGEGLEAKAEATVVEALEAKIDSLAQANAKLAAAVDSLAAASANCCSQWSGIWDMVEQYVDSVAQSRVVRDTVIVRVETILHDSTVVKIVYDTVPIADSATLNLAASQAVDLGLPSGTQWASCNVGATTPDGFGDFFAWGETVAGKETYGFDTYLYCEDGNPHQLTKYNYNPANGYDGYHDSLFVLQPEDDAATVHMGSEWHTPSQAEWNELIANTTFYYDTMNGVGGWRFVAENGNSIFLPGAGGMFEGGYYYSGLGDGNYWTSDLLVNYNGLNPEEESTYDAFAVRFSDDYLEPAGIYFPKGFTGNLRCWGFSVRGVRSASAE
ncbi:MAG: hypothetical protein IJ760_05015 [Bacteroidales bacterium]|nr:hypothetical protein [Bacteroidales bacterium]